MSFSVIEQSAFISSGFHSCSGLSSLTPRSPVAKRNGYVVLPNRMHRPLWASMYSSPKSLLISPVQAWPCRVLKAVR